MTTIARYQQLVANLSRSLAQVAKRPDVAHESAYYLQHVGGIKTVDDFLKDDRAYRFAMTAFGLRDMIFGKAFMRKVLTEGIDGNKTFALQLSDPRFREFAAAFNFKRYGAATMTLDSVKQPVVDKYVRVQLEVDAGGSDEGLRLALYFQRKAPGISSVYGLMGDSALYKVLQTALNLPASYSNVDIAKQAAFIGSKITLSDFKDSAKLNAFINRFAANWQMANGDATQSLPQIGLGQSALSSFSQSTLLSLQGLKLGGG